MASGLTPKIRLVMCPKCREVLQEFEDVPVYQCGGCDTILQAKNWKVNANGTSSTGERDTAQTNESQTMSEQKEPSGSRRGTLVHFSGECSLDQETGRGDNQSVESIRDQLADVKLSNLEQPSENQQNGTLVSNCVGSSSELGQNENEEAFSLAGENSNLRRLSSEDQPVAAREGTSSMTAVHRQEAEMFSSDGISPDEEGQFQKHGFHDSNHVVYTDTIENKDSFAYDGSESSYDGRDDEFPNRLAHPSKSQRLPVPDERPRNGKLPMNSMLDSDLEIHEQARSFSSDLFRNKHYGTRYSKWDRNQLLEPRGQNHPVRNWRRYGTEEYQSQMPFYQRVTSLSGAYFERGSPSDLSYNEFHGHSRLSSLEMPRYGGGIPFITNWKEKHFPRYYNHEAPDQIYHDMNYGRYPGGLGQGCNRSQNSILSRITFSGETMNRRYQRGESCLHPGQLPLPILHRFHLGQDYHNSYNSWSTSPQRHVDSDYYPRWSREIESDVDDRHRQNSGYEVKKYLRARHHMGKRHLRPTAGGAPFVVCHYCLKTVQLPVDFLIFKRRFHFLRCGACSNVLRFTLQDGTHLVPAVTDPQPSQNRDTNSNDSLNGNPISCSNDVADGKNMFHDSSSTMGERSGLRSKQSQCRHDNTGETSELGNHYSKDSKPVTRGSPLHQLMGYSTVSQVFKASKRPPSLTSSDHVPGNQTSKNGVDNDA